jgi:hypothetical protein
LKSNQIKSGHRVLRKNLVDTYGAPVFASDYSTSVLVAKMRTNSDEHSMYITFLCSAPKQLLGSLLLVAALPGKTMILI